MTGQLPKFDNESLAQRAREQASEGGVEILDDAPVVEAPVVEETAPLVDETQRVPEVEAAPEDLSFVQRADGKIQLGRFVGDTVEAVAMAAAKSQREAHSQLTKLQQQAKQPEVDPWAAYNQQQEDAQWIDPYESTPGRSSALDSIRATKFIEDVIASPNAKDEDFARSAVAALEINDPRLYERVMGEWADLNQYAAQGFRGQVEQAAQQMQYQQQRQNDAVQQGAYSQAVGVFTQQNADWQQYEQATEQYLQQNPALLQSAYQTGDPRAIYQAFDTAYQYARAVSGGAPSTQQVTQQQQIEAQKDNLHLEVGGGSDIVGSMQGNNTGNAASIHKNVVAQLKQMAGPQ